MRGLVRGRVLGRWEGIAVRFAINVHEIDNMIREASGTHPMLYRMERKPD